MQIRIVARLIHRAAPPARADRTTGLSPGAGGGVRTAPPTTQDHSMTHLDDKTALITGGGRGIGHTDLDKSVRERETGKQAA